MNSRRYAKPKLPVLFLLLSVVLVPVSCGAGAGIHSTLSPYLLAGAVAGTIFTTFTAVRRYLGDASSNPLLPPDRGIASPIELSDSAAKELIIEHRRPDSDLFRFAEECRRDGPD